MHSLICPHTFVRLYFLYGFISLPVLVLVSVYHCVVVDCCLMWYLPFYSLLLFWPVLDLIYSAFTSIASNTIFRLHHLLWNTTLWLLACMWKFFPCCSYFPPAFGIFLIPLAFGYWDYPLRSSILHSVRTQMSMLFFSVWKISSCFVLKRCTIHLANFIVVSSTYILNI